MRKFYCKELDEDIGYSRCCNSNKYDKCPDRDIEGTQRLIASTFIIIFILIILVILSSYLKEIL